MKKSIIIPIITGSILISALFGFWIGNKSQSPKNEKSFVYYCKWEYGSKGGKIWVDPEYNDYPMYYMAKLWEERYDYNLEPEWIHCEKIYQP